MKHIWPVLFSIIVIASAFGCSRPMTTEPIIVLPTAASVAGGGAPERENDLTGEPLSNENQPPEVVQTLPTPTATLPPPTPLLQPTRPVYAAQPTPDPPHVTQQEINFVEHLVDYGETLASIAGAYGSNVDELVATNGLADIDYLQVGQVLRIPTASSLLGPDFKLIPDSELVYGPAAADFNIRTYLSTYYPQSALLSYRETVEGRELDGVGVMELTALRFSVNPRLLLAMVEYRTGWVTRPAVVGEAIPYPMGYVRDGYEGLYNQLGWAANRVNEGFYGRAEGGWTSFLIADGTRVSFEPTINHGTAGVQNWLGAHTGATYGGWLAEAGANGFFTTYDRLFGSPFALTYEPLLPAGLQQPPMQLPWEAGVPWFFTGGPHGGWAGGSAWAALDFGPDRDKRGCYVSEEWVTAGLEGTIVYSDFGGLLVDQDGDGYLGTGWVIVYWHVDSQERAAAGTVVQAGDRLGHPSCEGGFSNGTHLHIARRYNGRWISADGDLPFVMDGWQVEGAGIEYDGYLVQGDESKEACACAEDGNEIIR